MDSYLYKNEESEILNSSSGGAFKRIISVINDEDDIFIYGAVWDEDLSVKHIYLKATDDIQQFSESKYARSRMEDCFRNIVEQLQGGKTVVFSGTPCQIAGLKSLVEIKRVDTTKLYLIDIICHGTPSPIILDEWKKSIERKYKKKVKSISFRDKKIGWLGYPTKVRFTDGEIIRRTYKAQEYIRLFFSHFIMAPSCYECPFSNMNRQSDITIGDFWGVENSFPDVNPGKGVSLVLANTKKGNDILERINKSKTLNETIIQCEKKSFLQYQHNLNKPTERPIGRDKFWNDFAKYGYDFAIKENNISSRFKELKYNIKFILFKLGLYNRYFN